MSSKTDWAFHRANHAINHPSLHAKEYAAEYGLSYNTARVRLAGDLEDETCLSFDFAGRDMRTGELIDPPPAKIKPKAKQKPPPAPTKDDRSSDRDRKSCDRKASDQRVDHESDRSRKTRKTSNRSTDHAAGEDVRPKKSKAYKIGRPRGQDTADRPAEKRRQIEEFILPVLGSSWATDHMGGYAAWGTLPEEVRECAEAVAGSSNALFKLTLGRRMMMGLLQEQMRADVERDYAAGKPWQMEGGGNMPKSMALSQVEFGPSQRMTELDSLLFRLQVAARNEHPMSHAEQIVYTNQVMQARQRHGFTAVEACQLLEAKGLVPPPTMAAEAQREISLMEPAVETGGGYTPEQLEAEARAGQAANREWREKGLVERRAEVEAMQAEELAAQNSALIDEAVFAAELAAQEQGLTLAELADGEPLSDEEVVEAWD